MYIYVIYIPKLDENRYLTFKMSFRLLICHLLNLQIYKEIYINLRFLILSHQL